LIPKASQRGGGSQLATHLQNKFDNEQIRVAEIIGAVAQDLHGAFAEWEAQALGTQCQKYLYHLSVSPWQDVNGPMSEELYFEFIDRAEENLGLSGNPRAVVFHEKNGREHAHIVWSRIYYDEEKDKLLSKQISHDRQKLRSLVQDFAQEKDLELPDNMKKDRGVARHFENAARPSHHQKQQQERSAISKEEHMQTITRLWDTRDTAKAFMGSLENSGYYLCRGDRRAYVVVDRYGEVHSLPKMIAHRGINKKQVQQFLEPDYRLDALPSVEKAKEFAATRADRKQEANKEDFAVFAAQVRKKMADTQQARRKELRTKELGLKQRQAKELAALKKVHQEKTAQLKKHNLEMNQKGIKATLYRITGLRALQTFITEKFDAFLHIKETKDLTRRHQYEQEDLARHDRSLDKIETYENALMERKLRHEQRARRRQQTETERGAGTPPTPPIEKDHEPDKTQDFEKYLPKGRKKDKDKDRDR
jgi:hypothetical protein